MAFVTVEDRVEWLEAMFGQFMAELALLNKQAKDRDKAAEERSKLAEERNRLAEERFTQFQDEMRQSKRALDKKWGELANKMGTIIEDILAPNLRRLAREHFGFETILAFMIRCTRRRADRLAEESEFEHAGGGAAGGDSGGGQIEPHVGTRGCLCGEGGHVLRVLPGIRRATVDTGAGQLGDP